MKHYDYIFAGAGLSALMTAYRMAVSGNFNDKEILLIDKSPKKSNDRTWCFWEKDAGEWDAIVSNKWDSALFSNEEFSRVMELRPYKYKMIKGIDFYNHVFETLSKNPNITFLNNDVLGFYDTAMLVTVKTESETFTCSTLINSIYNPALAAAQTKHPVLRQHFTGWFIKSSEDVFTPNCATFMDFSVPQKGNTRFMYVLPTSKTEALVEYTLFSKDLLLETEYEEAINDYLQRLGITDFQIVEKEHGSIPMTLYPFWKNNTKNIIHIGSAGGWTKASTGYTFKNTVKKSKGLVAFLQQKSDLTEFHIIDKFRFYDLLLLDILDRKNHLGSTVFSSLFRKGNPVLIFKFLDEETSFSEDLEVIRHCPKPLFIEALLHRIVKIF